MMVSGACFFLTSDAKPLVSIDTHELSKWRNAEADATQSGEH